MPSFFVVLEPRAWPAFAARAAAAGVPPLFGLGDERARPLPDAQRAAHAPLRHSRRRRALAARPHDFAGAFDCGYRLRRRHLPAAARDAAPHRLPFRKAADAAAFAALHPSLDDTGASAAAAAPPPRGGRERANRSRPQYFAGGATFAEIAAVLT